MEKPTVFFSHSSKDEFFLRQLKEVIDKKTGNAISIFLSSDGQSIPFGRNWVHSVEDALESTSLMFVFLSPESIVSSWVYFEAGYVYSKGVDVVPVGIFGIDLNQLHPPLSLLQGFNLDNVETLGNIIATINKVYDTSFDSNFQGKNFSDLFRDVSRNSIYGIINEFRLYLTKHPSVDSFSEIEKLLNEIDFTYTTHESQENNEILGYGIRIFCWTNGINFNIEGLLLAEYLPLISDIFRKLDDVKLESVSVYFEPKFSLVGDFGRQSALLKNTEIGLGDHERFQFKQIDFSLHPSSPNSMLGVYCDENLIDILWLEEVIRLLLEYGLVFDDDSDNRFIRSVSIG